MSPAGPLQTLTVDVDPRGVATVTMDRPEVRNAFNAVLIDELTTVARDLAADDTVRVVVLTGAGPVFSAGADLSWMGAMRGWSREENVADAARLGAMLRQLWDLPKPLIGRLNGHAIAGGTGLAAVCDIVVAVRGAKLGLTEVVLGLAPATISPFVVRKIGVSHARALFVTGELFDAEHGMRIGLVHHLADDVDGLDAEVEDAVARCLRAGPLAIAAAKLLPDLALDPLDVATARTPGTIADLRVSDEGQEGITAFFEKRSPAWVEAAAGRGEG